MQPVVYAKLPHPRRHHRRPHRDYPSSVSGAATGRTPTSGDGFAGHYGAGAGTVSQARGFRIRAGATAATGRPIGVPLSIALMNKDHMDRSRPPQLPRNVERIDLPTELPGA